LPGCLQLFPPPDHHLFAILAVVAVAGLIQGLAGFGSALIAVPLLARDGVCTPS
jgi:hypothetical protein